MQLEQKISKPSMHLLSSLTLFHGSKAHTTVLKNWKQTSKNG